jgi:hypothetical protein
MAKRAKITISIEGALYLATLQQLVVLEQWPINHRDSVKIVSLTGHSFLVSTFVGDEAVQLLPAKDMASARLLATDLLRAAKVVQPQEMLDFAERHDIHAEPEYEVEFS